MNSLFTGKPHGRVGTPPGFIDTGKDDKDGRPIYIDPLKTDLTTRGARITGLSAVAEGISSERPVGDIAKRAAWDVFQGAVQPWTGPPIRVAEGAVTGFAKGIGEGKSKAGASAEAIKDAALAINPTIGSFFQEGESGKKGGVGAVGAQLGSTAGYTKGPYPTHLQRVEEMAGKKPSEMGLGERLVTERKYRQAQPKPTQEQKLRELRSASQAQAERGKELNEAMPREDQQWLKSRGLELPQFSNRIHLTQSQLGMEGDKAFSKGQDLYLTEKEMGEYRDKLLEGYKRGVQLLRRKYDDMSETQREKFFHAITTEVRNNAKRDMLKQMQSESGKAKKKFSMLP
jgi:hypothetical protein